MGGRGQTIRKPKGEEERGQAEPGPDSHPNWVEGIRARLAEWYDAGHRDLPWRRDRDPYRVLVSEMMLVQTTVAAAAPYFERFVRRFPTVRDLAEADEAEVLKAWEGLGYYRRARQLQAAARMIVAEHGESVPRDLGAIRRLPGVGRYIAGAVLSFAYDLPAPIVEANTQRVLARWLAWGEDLKTPGSQARLWQAAERLVPPVGAGRFNQAFMELGATVCTPREPSCLVCPVASLCCARALGLQDTLPVRSVRAAPREVSEACALVVKDERLLVVQRGAGRLWEQFWEFPTLHLDGADPAGRSPGLDDTDDLAEAVRRLTGIRAAVGPEVRVVRYGVTSHRVTLSARAAVAVGGRLAPGPGMVRAAWQSVSSLNQIVLSAPTRRLVAWVAEQAIGSLARRVPVPDSSGT